ncbi:MAG: YbjQ family protein [Ruminococcus flavefaciens]|nr:YbjQ family protein [Ruminococcus flavefaciens]
MIIATGDIRQSYTIIDTVFAYGSQKEGLISGINMNKAFAKVKEDLARSAAAIGADAVVSSKFDYRIAVDGKKQVLEFFAYGTAVKLG